MYVYNHDMLIVFHGSFLFYCFFVRGISIALNISSLYAFPPWWPETHCLTRCAALSVEKLEESNLPPALRLYWLKRFSTADLERRKGYKICRLCHSEPLA